MIQRYKVMMFVFILLVLPVYTIAAPFIRSHTGLINAPTADVVGHLGVEVAGSGAVYKDASSTYQFEWDARFTAGLLDRFELGVTALTEKLYTGSFKLKFLDDSGELSILDGTGGAIPAIAWGIRDIHGRTDITSTGTDSFYTSDQNNSIYFVATKKFSLLGVKFNTSLGWGTNGFKADSPLLRKFGGIFAGTEVILPIPIPGQTSFLGEIDGKHLNTGLKYTISGISIGVAVSSIESVKSKATGAQALNFGGIISLNPKLFGLW